LNHSTTTHPTPVSAKMCILFCSFWEQKFYFYVTAIGNAFAVLSDPVKRKRYDQFGSEAEQASVPHHNAHHDYTRGFEGQGLQFLDS